MNATSAGRGCALNQGVLKTLMISFEMAMRDKLCHRSSEMAFPDRNDPIETLLLHGPHEPLRVRIRVRRLIGCLHHMNPCLFELFAHGRAPLGISVADQHATPPAVRHRDRSRDLVWEEKTCVWLDGQPRRIPAAAEKGVTPIPGDCQVNVDRGHLGVITMPNASGRCHGVPRNERARAQKSLMAGTELMSSNREQVVNGVVDRREPLALCHRFESPHVALALGRLV